MKNVNKLLACLGIAVACFAGISPAAYASVAGYVQFVSGDVQITSPAGQTRQAQKGEAVSEGDTLVSAPSASAQIKMQDGGFVAMRPDTKLKFDRFIFSGKQDGNEKSFFSLFKGGFRAVTGFIGQINKENYRITTPAATIGIRGTDHETFLVVPGSQLAQVAPAGAYNKVNLGETTLITNKGAINVLPNQMGFAGGMDQAPKLQPLNTNIFTVAPAPALGAKTEKKEEKKEDKAEAKQEQKTAKSDKEEKKEGGKDSKQADKTSGEAKGDAQATKQEGAAAESKQAKTEPAAPLRSTAVVDTAPPSAGLAPTVSPAAPAPVAVATIVAPPPAPTTVVNAVPIAGGATVNIITGAATTNTGQVVSVAQGMFASQAQIAAAAAANAAAGVTSFTFLVDTVPASNAISGSTTAVTAATLLAPANAATANATAAQAAATTAAARALAAQAALTANGTFADATAAPANTAAQTANTALQGANTAVQTAAGAATAQNTALTMAQSAASAALGTASANLNTAVQQNSVIASNQSTITNNQLTISNSSTAMQVLQAAGVGMVAVPTSLQLAVAAAQTAAKQATALQAAGDLAAAQAALATAQAAKAIVDAALAANTAVNASVANASAASAQAAAAQTASTAANAALVTSTTNLATVNTNVPIVAANASTAAYNNPAVATTNRFIGVLKTVVAPTTASAYIEGGGPGAAFAGAGTANTSFVLDGAGNLVESRHTWYEETPASTATTQVLVADANVKRTGGTAAEAFKLTDNSIYGGRWQGGSITVTDNASLTTPVTFTRNLGVTSEHWAIMLAPPVGYVQTLIGSTVYTKVAATSPTDALGNVGVLNTATLSANFTSMVVDAALNLTIAGKTMGVAANSMPINGAGFDTGSTPVAATCTGCASPYYANVGGRFAGNAAASAGLGYSLWAGAAPGATTPATDLIQGLAVFNTATPPTVLPFAAYVPSGITVAVSSPNWWSSSEWDSFNAAPADITYTAGAPSSFIHRWGGISTASITVLGAASPINGVAATTGIQFGRWTTATAIQRSYTTPLGTQFGAPDSWMYGPQGYLDTPTAMAGGVFNYVLDGNTAPYDRNTGLKGTLTSASLTANFTAMTISAALGVSMPGGQTWTANATNQPVSGNQFSAYAQSTVNTLSVTRNGLTCPTCGGNLMGGFTGQNYAGAILSYQLYDNNALGGGDVVGRAALTRAGVTGNPAVINSAPAPTGKYFVADYGGSLNQPNAITATGNLLTAYSWGSPATPAAGYGSTTVTCTTCTTTAAGTAVTGGTGIYYGAWQAGSWTNTWGGSISPGQFHWITGPEAGPVYLPEVLTGTVTYALNGGTAPTNLAGTAGTLNTATLVANFTKQVVGVSLNATVAGNTWSASTTAGNEMPLDYGSALGRTMFATSSYGSHQRGGLLTVTVNNGSGALPANGWVSGNLVGAGLTGAVLSYTLQGGTPWDQVNGAAAFVAPASNTAAPYRIVGVALTDPTSAAPLPGIGGLYNAASRVISDAAGNLTQFDISPVGDGSAQSLTIAQGTSTLANFGSDPITGISWGRWQGGVINVTDRATGTVKQLTLQGSAHWIAGTTMTAPVTLPTTGTYSYVLAGGTLPTNNLGVTGTLNSATLSANFTAQTVNVGVNATVGATTLGASANNLPIMQGAAFGAGNNMGAPLAVTCAGTCGAAGSNGGSIVGGFTGAGATGAGVMYSLGTGLGGAAPTVVSGVAAFHR